MTSESDCKDLFLAAQSNNVACLEAILTSGGCANSNEIAKVEGSEKHLVPVRGWTPLHVAAYHGHTEAIDTLIKSGANVNASDQFRHENDLIWQMLAKNNAALAHQVFDEVEKVKSLRQRHFQ